MAKSSIVVDMQPYRTLSFMLPDRAGPSPPTASCRCDPPRKLRPGLSRLSINPSLVRAPQKPRGETYPQVCLFAVGLMDATSNESCWENSKPAARKKRKRDFIGSPSSRRNLHNRFRSQPSTPLWVLPLGIPRRIAGLPFDLFFISVHPWPDQ